MCMRKNLPSELRTFFTYKTLIIEKIELPSVVNERQGDTDVGIVCLSHVVFHYHHVSFHFSLYIGAFINYWVCNVKLFVLIAVNNSLNLVCD